VRLIVRESPDTGEQDQDAVTVQSIPDVTFAVRCVSTLRPGAVQTSRVMNDALQPDHPLTISIGFRHYELRLQSARDDLADARVVLSDTSRTQVLYSADGFSDDPHYVVEWAGDLDGDGKLDLVVDLHRKYSVHPHRLLLSTRAARNQLLGEAAAFEDLD
jgi:hypothetical protein